MLLFSEEHLAIKFLLVDSALLLSASPVFTDESVYLECELQVVSQTTDKIVNKIINTEMVANVVQLKLDPVNRRMMSASLGVWEPVNIVNGVAVDDTTVEENGMIISTKASLEIDPPGEYRSRTVFANDQLKVSIHLNGRCKGVPPLVFEDALRDSKF